MRFPRLLVAVAVVSMAAFGQDYSAKLTEMVKEKKFSDAAKLLEDEDAKTKTAKPNQKLADAHVLLGNAYMYEDSLPPFQKYPSALRQFRGALKYDPENKKAKQNIETIEGIYKSMGRPVPQ